MKTLLLSSVPPCLNYTAGIVLEQICQVSPKGRLVSAAVVHPTLKDAIISKDLEIPHLRLERPYEQGFDLKYGLLSAVVTRVIQKNRLQALPKLVEEVTNFALAHNVSKLFVHLDTPYLIRMAIPLAEKLKIPLYTMVFDPPNWYLEATKMDVWTQKEVHAGFAKAISSSRACATASLIMAREYEKLYKTPCTPLMWSIAKEKIKAPAHKLHDTEVIRIGVAGKLYCPEAWGVFIKMLDDCSWRLLGKDVVLRYLGPDGASLASLKNVEDMGWQAQDEMLELLSECDVLYCPYLFDKKRELDAIYSFPSKAVGYLASGRPIVFHGPAYASPISFFEETQAGLNCTSLDCGVLYDVFMKLLSDERLYADTCRQGLAAIDKYFIFEVLAKNMKTILDT